MAGSIAGPGQLLTDIQVLGLHANQTGFYSQSGLTVNDGNGNIIQMTPNSVNTTQPVTNIYWHAYFLDYEPGVLNAGQTWPDIQMWWHVDTVDYSSYFYVDLTQPRSMFTHREITSGRRYLVLGSSMMRAATAVLQNGAFAGNFPGVNGPFTFCGPKISDGIDFWFASTSGFTTGSSGTFAVPPTIKFWGDVYDAATWAKVVAAMGGAWNGAIQISSVRRWMKNLGSYFANHQVQGLADIKTAWPQLPDGPGQGKTKVHRLMKFATPVAAVASTAQYVLSNKVTDIGGKPGQVGQFNELAWAYSGTQKAVMIDQFGRQPAAGTGYFGLTKGGIDIYPTDAPYGVVDTVGNPRAWYGDNSAYTGISGESDALPQMYSWVPSGGGPEVIAGEDAGFYVAAQNGQTIAANTDYTAVSGYQVEA